MMSFDSNTAMPVLNASNESHVYWIEFVMMYICSEKLEILRSILHCVYECMERIGKNTWSTE